MQLNITFAHLRYYIAGYRPSQTNFYSNVKYNIYYVIKDWYFTYARTLPNILHICKHKKTL